MVKQASLALVPIDVVEVFGVAFIHLDDRISTLLLMNVNLPTVRPLILSRQVEARC
ncbi:protein of unknown function [Candidatus Filomicrobium marinum]|uniref:Uncharacterized protein n=1 Tax=Candidatus Filomicrobium marinum TaxID=1608628 RepID=A0A0D6JFU3_9HYPH|nr:protein of unknown function [Candidatus Filomicrobium marinum]CPR19099.1 protein of unknown function [Candidatus Filomicrobium marinum]